MSKTYTLKTGSQEVIDYGNITVEVSEEKIIPQKTETIRKTYTVDSINSEIESINDQITLLQEQKTSLEDLKTNIIAEADKVVNAIK